MSPLALVELDKLARLCRASSILSFTVVGLDATISSYSDILATYSKVSAKILVPRLLQALFGCEPIDFRQYRRIVRTNHWTKYVLSGEVILSKRRNRCIQSESPHH